MKNVLVTITIGLLSIGVHAQDGAETVLMILEKDSNFPVCRFSDRVKVNSSYVPEDHLGHGDSTLLEDIRVCQEEDVGIAVKEEMTVGMAIGPANFFPPAFAKLAMVTSGIGCLWGWTVLKKDDEARGTRGIDIMEGLSFNLWIGSGSVGIPLLRHILQQTPFLTLPQGITAFGAGVLFSLVGQEICRNVEIDF